MLIGLGLFVGGLVTGVTAMYWGCVGACLLAAVLLAVARRNISAAPKDTTPATDGVRVEAVPGETDPVRSAAPAVTPATAFRTLPAPVDADTPGSANGAPQATAPPATAMWTTVPPAGAGAATAPADLEDPPVEEMEVTDLLLTVDMTDEVLVVDEHPRYHLAGCVALVGRTVIPLPHDEARADGFTPCGICTPNRRLADRARARKSSANG